MENVNLKNTITENIPFDLSVLYVKECRGDINTI